METLISVEKNLFLREKFVEIHNFNYRIGQECIQLFKLNPVLRLSLSQVNQFYAKIIYLFFYLNLKSYQKSQKSKPKNIIYWS
jgi:hypothetical protein